MTLPVRVALFTLAFAVSVGASARAEEAKPAYPAPAPPSDPSKLGLGVQRTMTLLATSTPAKRNRVRILFYGQSITEQRWSKMVAEDLRRRFPHADLEIENRAIGGFASALLVRPAEQDLYPFYPDLLIFHVYGGNNEYEQIIRNVRTRTAAEVLMQTDHVTRIPPDVVDDKTDPGVRWDSMMNNTLLPEIARKYDCGLVDVRTPWLAYLKANDLEPKALLSDDVHLNSRGEYLMAQLVGRHLVHRPDLGDEAWRALATTVDVGSVARWQNGRLKLEFEGNRVDVIAAPAGGKGGGGAAAAKVLIDGKKPSEFPGAYRVSRPSPGPWSPLTITRIDRADPATVPVPQEWTLKVTSFSPDPGGAAVGFNPDGASWAFDLTGSVTGPDGSGRDDATFVSRSGLVKIEPEWWFRNGSPPVGYEIKWKVLPMSVDRYEPLHVQDPAREHATALIQGIPNGKHTLELVAESGSEPPMKAVRTYRPPVR